MNLALYQRPCWRGTRPQEPEGHTRHTPTVAAALACHNAFGGGSSKQSTKTQQQQVAASEGSLAVGAGGKFTEAGATDLSNASNVGNTSNSGNLSNTGSITVTSADADVLNKALDSIAGLSAGFGSSLNQFVSQTQSDQDKKVATLLSAVDAAKQAQGSSFDVQKVFLYVAGGLVVVLVVFALRKKG